MQFEPQKVTISVILTGLLLPLVTATSVCAIPAGPTIIPWHQVQNSFQVYDDEPATNPAVAPAVVTPESDDTKTASSVVLDLPPIEMTPVRFNLDDFMPSSIVNLLGKKTKIKEVKIRVNIFPVLAYSTRQFLKEMAGDPIFAATPVLDGIKLTSGSSRFQIYSSAAHEYIASGNELAFNLKDNVFILDGAKYPFDGGIYVQQNADDIATIKWPGLKNHGDPLYFHGDFVASPQKTPHGQMAVKVINIVDDQTYLKETVPTEMTPRFFGPQSLGGQTIASWAFTIFKKLEYAMMGCDFDVRANTQDQEYGGVAREVEKSNMAVAAVRGLTLMFDNRIVLAMFSSNPVTQTVACKDYSMCKKDIPYLRSVQERHPKELLDIGTFVANFKAKDLIKYLHDLSVRFPKENINFPPQKVVSTEPVYSKDSVGHSGRPTAMKIIGEKSTIIVSGQAFDVLCFNLGIHALMGNSRLEADGSLSLTYFGKGHGVGLSQLGAKYDEEIDGWSYKQILDYYYPGAKLVDIRQTNLIDKFAI